MLTREQFELDVEPLRAALELRRRKYLRFYSMGAILSAVLLASAFFRPESALHSLEYLVRTPVPIRPSDIMAYRIFAALAACVFVLGPAMAYRGERGFSVEQAVSERLLSSFGAFIFVPGGAISAAEIRRLGFSIASLIFYPETGVVGEMNGVRVRITDAVLFRREDGQDTLVFKGLVIVSDIPRISPPVVNDELQAHMEAISEMLTPEKPAWDEKTAYAAAGLYARAKEILGARVGKDELPAEKEYRRRYAIRPRLVRVGSPNAGSAHAPHLVEYSASGCLAMAAGERALFTLGSLFRPALSIQQTGRIYEVMKSVDALTRHMRA